MADEPTEPTGAGPTDAGLRGRDLIGLGGLLAGSVVFFTGLGLVIDRVAGTRPVFTMLGVALGMLAGAFGFWARVRAAMR
jgi:F0F1-type ATP synthase assembly protein I